MTFEILPHTADLRLKVSSADLKDLFGQAALGMAMVLKKDCCTAPAYDVKRKISISAPNLTILLIDFLSEILTASYEEKAVFWKIDFLKFSENSLEAEISGTKVEGFDEDIKAVTYHEAEIKKTETGLETMIVFDI